MSEISHSKGITDDRIRWIQFLDFFLVIILRLVSTAITWWFAVILLPPSDVRVTFFLWYWIPLPCIVIHLQTPVSREFQETVSKLERINVTPSFDRTPEGDCKPDIFFISRVIHWRSIWSFLCKIMLFPKIYGILFWRSKLKTFFHFKVDITFKSCANPFDIIDSLDAKLVASNPVLFPDPGCEFEQGCVDLIMAEAMRCCQRCFPSQQHAIQPTRP